MSQTKLKYLFPAIFSVLFLITVGFLLREPKVEPVENTGIGADLLPAELKIKSEVETIQQSYDSKLPYQKYKQIKETVDKDTGVKYRVDEYVVWDGGDTPKSAGYQIYYEKPDGSIMSTGTGALAESESYDWHIPEKIVYDTTPNTTTSTIKEIK